MTPSDMFLRRYSLITVDYEAPMVPMNSKDAYYLHDMCKHGVWVQTGSKPAPFTLIPIMPEPIQTLNKISRRTREWRFFGPPKERIVKLIALLAKLKERDEQHAKLGLILYEKYLKSAVFLTQNMPLGQGTIVTMKAQTITMVPPMKPPLTPGGKFEWVEPAPTPMTAWFFPSIQMVVPPDADMNSFISHEVEYAVWQLLNTA